MLELKQCSSNILKNEITVVYSTVISFYSKRGFVEVVIQKKI